MKHTVDENIEKWLSEEPLGKLYDINLINEMVNYANMKNKMFIRTTLDNHCEQCIDIQPTPEMNDCIEVYVREMDNSAQYGPLYLTENEMEVFYQKMKEMFNHIKSQQG